MSTQLVLPAPAKLNLFLHIIGQRQDGYHQLQTLFQLLDYGDVLTFKRAPSLTLSSSNPALETDDNLIMRAARLLQQTAQVTANERSRLGASLHLVKNLPMGGGVGGGSSDAATTLLALNALWQLNLSMDELADLGLQLGADVPVFVRGQSAFGEGVGDILTPVHTREECYLVLVPPVLVETPRMFQHEALTRNTAPIDVSGCVESALEHPAVQIGHNDFEPLVRRLYPEVEQYFALLNAVEGTRPARMSGSGACLYRPFACRQQAAATLNALNLRAASSIIGFVTEGKTRSPLHVALEKYGYSVPQ